MSNKSLHPSPQLVFEEQQGVVVAPSHKQILSLYKKSENSGIPFDTILEVFKRGYAVSLNEQEAFNRVNSFIAGGKAMYMDNDLVEKRGLWDNIHAKRERIKHGSGEHMRKPGEKGAPTPKALKASQTEAANPAQQAAIAIAMKKAGKTPKNEAYTGAEKVSHDFRKPSSRFESTDELVKVYKEFTPGQTIKTIKKVVKEAAELYECNGNCTCGKHVDEDAKGYKNPTGGLTQKGRDHYNRESGGHLKAPVTTPPSKLKKGSKAANRRKSFCARMGGVEGPMRDEHGRPTRKALALRKWNC